MFKQAAIGFMVETLLLAAVCTAQVFSAPGMASITGRVVTLEGHPAENAQVEIQDALAGTRLQSAFTNSYGWFEISNIVPGRYVVVATFGLDRAEENVDLTATPATLTLRLPRSLADTLAGDNNIVSAHQMQVPGKARRALNRAREALARQRLEEATKQVAKALSLHPAYAEALMLRGLLKLDRNDMTGARADMEEATRDDPGFAMGHIALGATYNRMSLFDDALRVLDRGVALFPTSWQGYYEMGKAYLGKGDYRSALRQLDKAQHLAPDAYAPLHLVKANALLELKAYNQAVGELEAYLTRNPQGQGSDDARDALKKTRAFVAKAGK